ncbi:recombinase family protein [Clostridium sp. LBM24168]
MLSNEKYIGVVRLLKPGDQEIHYVSENNHHASISEEKFKAVQIKKSRRSNIIKSEDGVRRKSRKYSSKHTD